MAGFSNEDAVNMSRNLMVAHGAVLGILTSLIGSAVEHPILFNFLMGPMSTSALGFGAAMVSYYNGELDPPPDHLFTRLLSWLPIWGSGILMIASLALGWSGFAKLAADAMSRL